MDVDPRVSSGRRRHALNRGRQTHDLARPDRLDFAHGRSPHVAHGQSRRAGRVSAVAGAVGDRDWRTVPVRGNDAGQVRDRLRSARGRERGPTRHYCHVDDRRCRQRPHRRRADPRYWRSKPADRSAARVVRTSHVARAGICRPARARRTASGRPRRPDERRHCRRKLSATRTGASRRDVCEASRCRGAGGAERRPHGSRAVSARDPVPDSAHAGADGRRRGRSPAATAGPGRIRMENGWRPDPGAPVGRYRPRLYAQSQRRH